MRNIYTFCDNCGAGHIHKLPSNRGILTNQWSWTKTQYEKCREVMCPSCKQRKMIVKKHTG